MISGTLSLNGNSWVNFGAINNSGTLNSGSSATIYAAGDSSNNSGTLNHTSRGALENRGTLDNSGRLEIIGRSPLYTTTAARSPTPPAVC